MGVLLATADQGRVLREGVRVVIYGATNAGKSSLLNRLLGYDRVIVSDTHGTTRDTIEETVNLEGVPVRLLDTAGCALQKANWRAKGLRAPKNHCNWQTCAFTSQTVARRSRRILTVRPAIHTRSLF